MCGCVPSRYGDDLPDELPEVAAFVKADEEDGIVAVIDGVLGVEREIAAYIPQVKRTVEAPLLTSRFPMAATAFVASA